MVGETTTRRRLLALGGAALSIGLAGCTTHSASVTTGSGGTRDENGTATPQASERESVADSEYARVYRQAIDSVVLVEAGRGSGTGFVFDDGNVVTNAHVVGNASATDLRFGDGQWRSGQVVGTDPHSDLAAIAVEDPPSAATPLPLSEGEAAVGQEVVAIGNPFELDGTVTTGVVSGTDRLIPAPTGYRIPDAIQTDAAVNPGNSGGPLMSLDGAVLAVVNSGGGDNIAFGISAALARRVVPALVETGSYRHAYLGATFTDVTPDIAAANGLDEPRGLLVVDVADDGPAEGALRPSDDARVVDGQRVWAGGDVVLSVGGEPLETAEDLWSHLALRTRPGETIDLTVLRDGTERTVEVELGVRPS